MALDFVAGCLGGCAGVIIGHPFDTVKVKLQTQDYRNPIYRGTWDCFSKILRKESVTGIYRGVSSPMVGVAMVNAIVFGVHGNVQRKLEDPDSLWSHFLSGAVAGVVQSVVSSPVELLKTRVQVSNQFTSVLDCFSKTIKHEGLRGVFKGLGVTATREFFGYGLYFSSYEALTKGAEGSVPISTAGMLLAGGMAGTISWIFTYPLDVIKSRFQADLGRSYTGTFDCLRKSVSEEGLAVLMRGLTPTLIRAFPTNAVTFTVVTWTFRLAELGTNKTDIIKENIRSILETLMEDKVELSNNVCLYGGSIILQKNSIACLNQSHGQATAGDFWVDNHDEDYFEEPIKPNINQIKDFQSVENFVDDVNFYCTSLIESNDQVQLKSNNSFQNTVDINNENLNNR